MTVTNYDGRLEAMAGYSKALYINLAKINEAYYNEETTLYGGTLPAKYADIVDISMIGGRTLALNQLVDAGTASVDTVSGHKYFTYISGTASVITSDGSAVSVVDDAEDMVIDLTLMFGPGGEPADATAFEAIMPSLYEYDLGSLISAGVTSVVTKDADDNVLDTYTIPADVQALEGYGWSTLDLYGEGNHYNCIDIANKKYVQNVGAYTFTGTETFTLREASRNVTEFTAICNLTSVIGGGITNRTYIFDRFSPLTTTPGTYVWTVPWTAMLNPASAYSGQAYFILPYTIKDGISQASTGGELKAAAAEWLAANKVTFYYQLATPVETDISISSPNIKAEAGGSIVLENGNGDDYRIPVPATIELVGVL